MDKTLSGELVEISVQISKLFHPIMLKSMSFFCTTSSGITEDNYVIVDNLYYVN